ncbi:MAG TPA: O-antigen ligase family protein, partial [Tepidisphaeraceae bacterium]
IGLAALMAIVLAARQLFQRDVRFIWSWAYLPIVLFILLAAFQLVALPDRVLASLSPHTARTKSELLGDLPNGPSLLHSITLTFYAEATRLDLRKLLAVATVFVVVLNVYRRSWQIKRLLLTISIIGFGVALVALWQTAFGGRMIYGIVPAVHLNSGPFLNHSHFGQFMNLSIGAMLALLLVRVAEITEGSRTFDDSVQLLRYSSLNFIYVLGVMILVAAATVFFSLTRGGVVSMLIAAAVTAVVYVLRRGRRSLGTVMFVLAGVLLLAVLYAGFGLVFERLATLRGVTENNGDRMQLLRDLSQVWRQFPVWGTGLGTHRYIFPMYDHSVIYSLAAYAENEYAQLMEEAGAFGLALCLAFLGIVVASYVRCILGRSRRPVHYAAYGLGFGLLAILIHSASDFGQHDPANASLTATFAALLIGMARHARPAEAHQPSRLVLPARRFAAARVPLGIAALAAVAGIFIVPLRTADAFSRARTEWANASLVQASLNNKGWDNGTEGDYRRLLDQAEAAVMIVPKNAVMRYWLGEFRWQSISAPRDPKTGKPLPMPPGEAVCVIDDLNRARADCPTYAPIYALAGQVDYFVLHKPQGAALIRTAFRLDPNEPVSCEAVAQLDSIQGQWEPALAEARRALVLDRPMAIGNMVGIFVSSGRPDLAHELVRGDLGGLDLLSDMLKADPRQKELVARCEAEATNLLLDGSRAPSANSAILARAAEIYEQRGDHPAAIDCYERALAKNYGQLDWRRRLADLLAKSGKEEDAERELEVCLRLHPNWEPAATMLDELRARRSHASSGRSHDL